MPTHHRLLALIKKGRDAVHMQQNLAFGGPWNLTSRVAIAVETPWEAFQSETDAAQEHRRELLTEFVGVVIFRGEETEPYRGQGSRK